MKSCVRTSLCLAFSLTSLYPADEIPVKQHWLTVTQAASTDGKRADFQIQNPGPSTGIFVLLQSSYKGHWFTETFSLFDRVKDEDMGPTADIVIPPRCILSGSYDLERASKGMSEAGAALRICVERVWETKKDGLNSADWAPEAYSAELSVAAHGEADSTFKRAKGGIKVKSELVRFSQTCSTDGKTVEWRVENLGDSRTGQAALEMEDSKGDWIEVSRDVFEGPSFRAPKEIPSPFYSLPKLATLTAVYPCADVPIIRNSSGVRRVRIAWHPWGKHSPPAIRSDALALPAS